MNYSSNEIEFTIMFIKRNGCSHKMCMMYHSTCPCILSDSNNPTCKLEKCLIKAYDIVSRFPQETLFDILL